MQVDAVFHPPVAKIPAAKSAPRVRPVNAIVRYSSSRSHDANQNTYEAALEGEVLRGAGPGKQRNAGTHQVLSGLVVNAARAVSAYANVSASADGSSERRLLDLHV